MGAQAQRVTLVKAMIVCAAGWRLLPWNVRHWAGTATLAGDLSVSLAWACSQHGSLHNHSVWTFPWCQASPKWMFSEASDILCPHLRSHTNSHFIVQNERGGQRDSASQQRKGQGRKEVMAPSWNRVPTFTDRHALENKEQTCKDSDCQAK